MIIENAGFVTFCYCLIT